MPEAQKQDIVTRTARWFHEHRKTPRYEFTKLRLPNPFRKNSHEGLRVHVTHDYDAAREILKRHESYQTIGFVKKGMGRFIGTALILDNGESWKDLHKRLVGFFSKKSVSANVLPIAAAETKGMTKSWLARRGPIDVEREMRTLTARVIMPVVFGDSMSDRNGREMIEATSVSIDSLRAPNLLMKLSRMVGQPYDRIPPASKAMKEANDTVTKILTEVVTSRRKLDRQPDDILGRLIEAQDVGTKNAFDDTRIMNNALMFIVAGHETTAEALTFTLHELTKHPRELEFLMQEVSAARGGRPGIDAGDYPSMPRAKDGFREALRMHPTAWQIGRESHVDEVIHVGGEIGDIEMRKGDLILIDLVKMHHDKAYFDRPDEFLPGRFADYQKTNPRGLMSFGDFARVCIAPEFAIGEGTVAVAGIFNDLSLRVLERPTGDVYAFTTRPEGRFLVEAAPRHP
jgi:cytochrome P450